MKISEFCRNRRLKSGSNIKEFALKNGKSRTFVENVEKGDYDNPSLRRLKTIVSTYQITREELSSIEGLNLTEAETEFLFANQQNNYYNSESKPNVNEVLSENEELSQGDKTSIIVKNYLKNNGYSPITKYEPIIYEDILCTNISGNKVYIYFFENLAMQIGKIHVHHSNNVIENILFECDELLLNLIGRLMLNEQVNNNDELILVVFSKCVYDHLIEYSVPGTFLKTKILLLDDGISERCINR